MSALQLLQSPNLPHEPRFGCPWCRPEGREPEPALPKLLPPARQHERVNVERLGDRLHVDPRAVTELDGRAFERHAVLLRFFEPARGIGHLLWLGGSVYFIEGGSAVGLPTVCQATAVRRR